MLEEYIDERGLLSLGMWLRAAYGENKNPNPEHCLIPNHEGYLIDVPLGRTKRGGVRYRQRLREVELVDYILKAYQQEGALRSGVQVLTYEEVTGRAAARKEVKTKVKTKSKEKVAQATLSLDAPPPRPAAPAQVQVTTPRVQEPAAVHVAVESIQGPWEDLQVQVRQNRELIEGGFGDMRKLFEEGRENGRQTRQKIDDALALIGGVQSGQESLRGDMSSVQDALATLRGQSTGRAGSFDSGGLRDALAILGGLSGGADGEDAVVRCFSLMDDAVADTFVPPPYEEVTPTQVVTSPSEPASIGDSAILNELARHMNVPYTQGLISVVINDRVKRAKMLLFLHEAGITIDPSRQTSDLIQWINDRLGLGGTADSL
jgi:hypothetical protein